MWDGVFQVRRLFPDRLNRKFTAEAPLLRLVTDITYVRIGNDFAYLSVVQDLYNNKEGLFSIDAHLGRPSSDVADAICTH